MAFQHKITIFTPTYNRAYILKRLYRSIQRQTFRDFEWLIVDDGSTDNTAELVQSWITEGNDFPIRYYKQENGGKCRAINRALDLAQGELFFPVDSDDYLTDDALEKVVRWEKELPKGAAYCGVAGNIGTAANRTNNRLFKAGCFDGSLLDRYKTVDGERAIVFYTKIHRQYKYPTFDGETFITEAVAYNRMAHDGYKMRFYNDIIWVYEYLDDGLTKAGSSLFLKNPRGYGLWLREKAEFLGWNRKQILEMYYTFTCDLSPYYDNCTIAECIGAPVRTIALCRAVHSLRRTMKGKKAAT